MREGTFVWWGLRSFKNTYRATQKGQRCDSLSEVSSSSIYYLSRCAGLPKPSLFCMWLVPFSHEPAHFGNVGTDDVKSMANMETKWAAPWQNQQNDLCLQSDQSSQCAQWVAGDSMFLHADSKDSDQTGWTLGEEVILLVLAWGGSIMYFDCFYNYPKF